MHFWAQDNHDVVFFALPRVRVHLIVPVSSYWSCQTASLGSGDSSLIFFSCKVTHLPFAVHKKCMVWIRNQWNISWDHVYIICSSNSFCIWLPLMPMWWLENGDFLSLYSKCIRWHSPLCFFCIGHQYGLIDNANAFYWHDPCSGWHLFWRVPSNSYALSDITLSLLL